MGGFKMKVKELIEYLKSFEPEAEVIVSSDEELNTLYTEFQVAVLAVDGADDSDVKEIVIYGLSGTEKEEMW